MSRLICSLSKKPLVSASLSLNATCSVISKRSFIVCLICPVEVSWFSLNLSTLSSTLSNHYTNLTVSLWPIKALWKSTFRSDSSVLSDLKSNLARLNDCSRVPSCFVKYSDMSVSVASGLIKDYFTDCILPEVWLAGLWKLSWSNINRCHRSWHVWL